MSRVVVADSDVGNALQDPLVELEVEFVDGLGRFDVTFGDGKEDGFRISRNEGIGCRCACGVRRDLDHYLADRAGVL